MKKINKRTKKEIESKEIYLKEKFKTLRYSDRVIMNKVDIDSGDLYRIYVGSNTILVRILEIKRVVTDEYTLHIYMESGNRVSFSDNIIQI